MEVGPSCLSVFWLCHPEDESFVNWPRGHRTWPGVRSSEKPLPLSLSHCLRRQQHQHLWTFVALFFFDLFWHADRPMKIDRLCSWQAKPNDRQAMTRIIKPLLAAAMPMATVVGHIRHDSPSLLRDELEDIDDKPAESRGVSLATQPEFHEFPSAIFTVVPKYGQYQPIFLGHPVGLAYWYRHVKSGNWMAIMNVTVSCQYFNNNSSSSSSSSSRARSMCVTSELWTQKRDADLTMSSPCQKTLTVAESDGAEKPKDRGKESSFTAYRWRTRREEETKLFIPALPLENNWSLSTLPLVVEKEKERRKAVLWPHSQACSQIFNGKTWQSHVQKHLDRLFAKLPSAPVTPRGPRMRLTWGRTRHGPCPEWSQGVESIKCLLRGSIMIINNTGKRSGTNRLLRNMASQKSLTILKI